jgi:phosphate transport system permease protein
MSVLTGLMTFGALLPLLSVLYLLVTRGGRQLSLAVLTELPPAALMPGGGFGNAIVGTLVMVGIATALSVPFGIMGAVFVAEFGLETRTAAVVRFAAKVLTGLPSILAGVFAYAAVVLATGGFSAPAGGMALAVLMLPIVLLTAEEAIKRVPARMREAAVGMGATPTQVVLGVVLPTAMPGILTGVMLAVARAAGETAPLLFTALFSDYWISRSAPAFLPKVPADLMKPTASLAVLIYNFSSSPFDNQIELAWAAALVLVAIVLVVNVVGQIVGRRSVRR